jgi:hypothetical protein
MPRAKDRVKQWATLRYGLHFSLIGCMSQESGEHSPAGWETTLMLCLPGGRQTQSLSSGEKFPCCGKPGFRVHCLQDSFVSKGQILQRGERIKEAFLPDTDGSIIKKKAPPVSHDRRGLPDLK